MITLTECRQLSLFLFLLVTGFSCGISETLHTVVGTVRDSEDSHLLSGVVVYKGSGKDQTSFSVIDTTAADGTFRYSDFGKEPSDSEKLLFIVNRYHPKTVRVAELAHKESSYNFIVNVDLHELEEMP